MEHSLNSSPAHTPGPWIVRDSMNNPEFKIIENKNGHRIACSREVENAHLIAAAPELLVMCKILHSIWVGEEPSPQRVIEITAQLEDAIAAAENRPTAT